MSGFTWTKPVKAVHEDIVRIPAVGNATYMAALPAYARAVANLQAVRGDGEGDSWDDDEPGHRFHIEITRGDVCDAFVTLVGPNALALEYGWGSFDPDEPGAAPTHIMTDALSG